MYKRQSSILIIISEIINFKAGFTTVDIFQCADVKSIELSAKEFLLQRRQ
jgi:hypothetical protein